MPLELPTREALAAEYLEEYRSAFAHRKNTSRGSDAWRLARVASGLGWSVASRVAWLVRQLLPDTAEGDVLRRWAGIYDLPFLGPAPASGVDALEVTGAPGATVPMDAELAHADGTLYRVVTEVVVGGGGSVLVDVEAKTKGAIGNKLEGDVLAFTAPPGGLSAEAVLVVDLENGTDDETEEEYRLRLGAHLAEPPEGGALHDYANWARRVPGVKTSYVWKWRRGQGTIDVGVLGKGTGVARILASTQAVFDYIDSRRPAMVADFQVVTIVEAPTDVLCKVAIDETTYRWDWVDDGVGYLVSAANAGAKQVTVPTLPLDVVVEDRITIRGYEARVTARAGAVLTLDVWPGVDPVGKRVRASGDLVVAVQAALRAIFDGLGPVRGPYAATAWEDVLVVSKLQAAATGVSGVRDGVVVTPAANVTGVDDPLSLNVPLITPGAIEVVRL